MTFKLLFLPILALECVLRRMDGLDLIVFATISKRTRRYTKSINKKIPSIDAIFGIPFFEQIEIQFIGDTDRSEENEEESEEKTYESEENEEGSGNSYVFKFCDRGAGKNETCSSENAVVLDGMELAMRKTQVGQETTCSFDSSDRILAAMKFVEFLCQTFTPNNIDLTLGESIQTEFKAFVQWNLLKEVKDLGFHVDFKVTNEQFKMFHDFVRRVPKQSLSFTFPDYTNKDHRINATFNDDVLCVNDAAWFKKNDFDLLNVRVFHLRESKLVNEDVRYMLHKWMTTASWKLEKAEIEMDEPDLNLILEEFEVVTTAQLKKRFPQLEKKELNFDHDGLVFNLGEAKHLQRMDSTIATIQLNDEQNTLCFSVWTKKIH
ncbi:hypothetical protein CAEBREN_13174 [Caenorhabditis brenneri]|uniref:F-box domain-containing protein n=1 Tax=Caenorhabditis brenneri TaxID=135651 RepID=G0N4A0_CAEBE|nr:hypothetical protein CAEBREN_13174 [Caenorhabditis brenneri]